MRTKPVAAGLACALAIAMIVVGQGSAAVGQAMPTYPYSSPTTVVPAPPATMPSAPGAKKLSAFAGLGTWVDVYDWTTTWHKVAASRTSVSTIDAMANAGVQTLYIQTAKWDSPTQVHEPARLKALIVRAKERGMSVVAWYVPTFENVNKDLARLVSAATLPGVDALAVDIESGRVVNTTTRNRRLVEESLRLRRTLPNTAIAAVPYPPVVLQTINTALWPNFPWRDLAAHYDVWMPMSYQSHRTTASGWRDGYRYTAGNIDRVRAALGSNVRIHTIGGIADATSEADVLGIMRASIERGVIGGSLYDWATTPSSLIPSLQAFRTLTLK